jgi:hypothetical protein
MRALLTVYDAFRKNRDKEELKAKVEQKTKDIEIEFANIKSELLEKLQEDENFAPKYSEELKKAKSVYEKGVQNAKKDIYDYDTDADNRFVLDDYSNYSDEELLNKLNSVILSTGSSFYKNKSDYDFIRKLNGFLNDKYPNYYKGQYGSDEEIKNIKDSIQQIREKQYKNQEILSEVDKEQRKLTEQFNYNYIELEKDQKYIENKNKKESLIEEYQVFNKERIKLEEKLGSLSDSYNRLYFDGYGGSFANAITFRDAIRLFNKLKLQLNIIGVKVEDIQSAQDEMNEKIESKREELANIGNKALEMFEIFKKEFEERKDVAPTVLERVDEFSDANQEYLTKFLNPFAIDIQKPIKIEEKPKVIEEITKEVIFVEPKKKVEPKGKIINVIDTSKIKPKKSKTDLEFLQDKLEATKDLIDVLEMTDGDSKDLEYLKNLFETTEDLISLMELA